MKKEIEYIYNKLKKLRFDFNRIDFENFRSEYRYDTTLKRYVRKDDNDLFIDKNTFKPLEEELEYADKCHSLEEELGCPLEILYKMLKSGYIYTKTKKKYLNAIALNRKSKYIIVSDDELGMINRFNVSLSNYKKSWYLKKDRSE